MGNPVPLDTRGQRWTVDLAGTWRTPGSHINLLELETVILAVRWLGRQVKSIVKRICFLVDNKVTVCVIAKGRSSSNVLLRALRRLTGFVGILGIFLHVIYIPSELNPADIASRVQGILEGLAPRVPWTRPLWRFLDTFRVVTGGFLEFPLGSPVLTDAHRLAGLATGTPLGLHLNPRFLLRDTSQWDLLLRALQ